MMGNSTFTRRGIAILRNDFSSRRLNPPMMPSGKGRHHHQNGSGKGDVENEQHDKHDYWF
jgi:hypothetical protein